MRHTGGLASGETSTRSSPASIAMRSACSGVMIPSCSPLSAMTRTSRVRIFSLILSFFSMAPPWTLGPENPLGLHPCQEIAHLVDGLGADFPLFATSHRHGPGLDLAIPGHQHVGDLAQLRVADLRIDPLVPLVLFDPQSGCL